MIFSTSDMKYHLRALKFQNLIQVLTKFRAELQSLSKQKCDSLMLSDWRQFSMSSNCKAGVDAVNVQVLTVLTLANESYVFLNLREICLLNLSDRCLAILNLLWPASIIKRTGIKTVKSQEEAGVVMVHQIRRMRSYVI